MDQLHQLRLYLMKQFIDHIILLNDRYCLKLIAVNKRINTSHQHHRRLLRHVLNIIQMLDIRLIAAKQRYNNLRNISGVISDTLHIRDHFQCRGNLTQISRYRLLL